MAVVLRLLVILVLGYGLVCLAVYLFQAKLVYFPGSAPESDPGDQGLEFRELTLVARDGPRLHAWFLPAEDARGAVLVCHGNAGSIEQRIDTARTFLALGWSVLLFDYRGYGKSTGAPDEAGTYVDAETAYEQLVQQEGVAPERLVLYGESLGVAMAIELARRRPVLALVAESGFTSLPDVGASVYPLLPVRLLSRYRYDNLAKVGAIGIPLLVIHSPEDEIIPVEHGRRLFAAAREPKQMLETEAGHNDGGFQRRPEWRAAVGEFLEKALAGVPASR